MEGNIKIKKCSKCNIDYESYSSRYMCKKCNKEYNDVNKNNIKNYNKVRYENNKETILEKIKIYHKNNKETIKKYTKKWFQENKEHINNYCKNKYKNDPKYRLKTSIYNYVNQNLKKEFKNNKTLKLLGCTVGELKIYLEQQFLPEMNWDNHGIVWEIDHIIPIVSFDFENYEQQNQCFHYTNLQPLFKTTEIAEQLGYKNKIGNRNKKDKI